MNPASFATGIAFRCDTEATILDVIRDDIGLEQLHPGSSLQRLVDEGSRRKVLDFLVELRSRGTALGWEVNLVHRRRLQTLHLWGVLSGNALVIIGTYIAKDGNELEDELLGITHEQSSGLRSVLQEHTRGSNSPAGANMRMYEDMTRLNNELVNVQRDLAKKNAELERLYAELQRLTITDSLTGLFNRRGFFEIGERELKRARRLARPLAGLIFDLDHFKQVNDTFGHPVGDRVLEEVVVRCSKKVRSVDVFGRYGGEEFALLLSETSRAHAREVAERLRQLAGRPMSIGEHTLSVTISVGIAMLDEDTEGLQDLLTRADQSLYRAKEAGRNRVCIE